MEDEQDKEARTAAQGLLDIAIKASRRSADPTASGQRNSPQLNIRIEEKRPDLGTTSVLEQSLEQQTSSPTIAAFRPILPRHSMTSGRIITSGNTHPVVKPKGESPQGFRPPDLKSKDKFFQPKPRKPEPQERVTLIVSKPQDEAERAGDEEANEPRAENKGQEDTFRKSSFDLPVPPSAFAIPGRVSGAESIVPRSRQSELQEQDRDTESDEENKDRLAQVGQFQPPAKKPRLDRQMSINAVLQQVSGHDENMLSGAQQTVQDLMPWAQSLKRQREASSITPADSAQVVQRLWGGPPDPVMRDNKSIMPRNSSDKSTLEVHRQLAQRCSGETINNQAQRLQDVLSTELDPNIRQNPSVVSAQTLIGSAPLKSDQLPDIIPEGDAGPATNEPRQEVEAQPEEDADTTLWTGSIKHRLKTQTGSSVAELFSIHIQMPTKLMELVPPTIYVNVLVGRANVKLGKHFVASCRLANPTERQLQKVRSLATMKLVAICELQHCTITLVPYTSPDQSLKLAAFVIDDE